MALDRAWGDKIRKTVILDSSALLSFFEFSIDWEKELGRLLDGYILAVPTAVVKELAILATQGGGEKKKASAALKLIAKYETIDAQTDSADEACVEIAGKINGIVLTNDTKLRERLRNRGIPVIFLRGKKRLALDE